MTEVSRSPGPAPAVTPTPARTVSSSPGAGAAVRGRRSASGGAGSSEGERLPEATRAALEQGLGADLSAVRVRRDSRSQEVAKRLSARAFAYGPTIVLGPNERPDDLPLMAHEAAHVVQQGAAPRLQAYSSSGGDSLEHEARAASSAVSSGQSYQVQGTSAPRVQRLGLSDILDYFADKANNIPGFRMFTVIIGVNPINGASVERSGANIIRAIIEFLPGGKLITDALENNGVLAKVGAWVEGQFKTLGMVGSAFKNALSEFIDSLGWRDIFHLGDVWTRAKRIFTDPIDRLIDFGKGLLMGIIRFVKEAVLRPLGKLAEGTRGYDLLKAVLGSDPVTGDTVPQTAETLIGGFMKLINQEEIWNNIKKSNAIPRAWAWFKKALKGLWALVSSFPQRVIDGFKSLELFDIVLVPRAFIKIGKVFLGFLADFISWAGGTIWDLLKIIFAVVAPEVMPYLSKVEASFKTILKDPIRFVKNLVAAGKLGFNQFRDKIGTHLKNSLIDWLTGSLPGVYIPKALEIKEILLFVLSVLGISWTNIRAKLVKQFGEPVVKGLEVGFTVVKKLVTEGPAAAWDEIKSELGNLREQAMGAITTYVVETVVKKAAAKLVSMLIPGAAFIQAILTTYDTVMVFVDKLSKIVQVVKAFLDSIMAIAAGQLGAAASKVESTLAGLLTLAISFLAGFAGLGRIADKIMGLLKEKVWTPIDKALDKGVAAIGNAGKAVLARLTGKSNPSDSSSDTPTSKSVKQKIKSEVASQHLKGAGQARSLLDSVYSKYSAQGLKGVRLIYDRKTPGQAGLKVSASLAEVVAVLPIDRIGLSQALAYTRKFSYLAKKTVLYVYYDEDSKPYKSSPIYNAKNNEHAEMVFKRRHFGQLKNRISLDRKEGILKTPIGQKVKVKLDLNRLPCPNCSSILAEIATSSPDLAFTVNAASASNMTTPEITIEYIEKMLSAGVKVNASQIFEAVEDKIVEILLSSRAKEIALTQDDFEEIDAALPKIRAGISKELSLKDAIVQAAKNQKEKAALNNVPAKGTGVDS